VLDALAAADIEARPVWKPMHLQPVFAGARAIGGTVAADLFARGLCLPSGSGMSDAQQARVIEVVRATGRRVDAQASRRRDGLLGSEGSGWHRGIRPLGAARSWFLVSSSRSFAETTRSRENCS
jgi:hypothetical protein